MIAQPIKTGAAAWLAIPSAPVRSSVLTKVAIAINLIQVQKWSFTLEKITDLELGLVYNPSIR